MFFSEYPEMNPEFENVIYFENMFHFTDQKRNFYEFLDEFKISAVIIDESGVQRSVRTGCHHTVL